MINSDQGRRVFALEVGGLLYRYHSGGGVTGLASTIATGINYQDIEGIVEVSSVSSSLDIAGERVTPVSFLAGADSAQLAHALRLRVQ